MAGYKLFATGDVLTAAQVNTFLMRQTTMVFADSAARTAALAGVLTEGMLTYLTDTNSLEYYDGAAFQPVSNPGDITGVTAGTGISGGGASGDVTITNAMATAIDAKGDLIPGTGADTFARLVAGANETRLVADSGETTGLKYVADTTNFAVAAKGDLLVGTAADTLAPLTVGADGTTLVADSVEATGLKWVTPVSGGGGLTFIKSQTIGSAVSAITVTNAFSATHDNYFITINGGVASTNNTLDLQLGSTTTGYFYFGVYGNPTSATVAGDNGNNTANFRYVGSGDTSILSGQFTLQNPNLAKRTMIYATSNRSGTGNINLVFNGSETSATQHTAFTLLVNTGTITGGTIRVYGYQNS